MPEGYSKLDRENSKSLATNEEVEIGESAPTRAFEEFHGQGSERSAAEQIEDQNNRSEREETPEKSAIKAEFVGEPPDRI